MSVSERCWGCTGPFVGGAAWQAARVSTWISRLDDPGPGLRLAVKDCIDVAETVTTAGCAALADEGLVATQDADVVAAMRAAGARVVGKTNLHELCFGTTGENPWFGNPINPLDPSLVPGGSSSGSAVAVATGEADLALGTDTGGSVRIPAACCGVVGLKTTFGRVSTAGVWPLAPSFDTVGLLARDVATISLGMALIEPGFTAASPATVVGRLRLTDALIDPDVDRALDEALARAEVDVVEVVLDGVELAARAFRTIDVQAWASNRRLVEDHPDRVGEAVRRRLLACRDVDEDQLHGARDDQAVWTARVQTALERAPVLVLPTLAGRPVPTGSGYQPNHLVSPFNVSGHPALSLPLRVPGWHLPGSAQLVAGLGREDLLCGTGAALAGVFALS